MKYDGFGALAAYKDFLDLWKEADPDIPILKDAKAEYAKLRLADANRTVRRSGTLAALPFQHLQHSIKILQRSVLDHDLPSSFPVGDAHTHSQQPL